MRVGVRCGGTTTQGRGPFTGTAAHFPHPHHPIHGRCSISNPIIHCPACAPTDPILYSFAPTGEIVRSASGRIESYWITLTYLTPANILDTLTGIGPNPAAARADALATLSIFSARLGRRIEPM